MGFSPLVNQRLLPPTFPRYTKIKDRTASFDYLDELTQNLKHVCKVINCTNYQSALNFFIEFSKKSSCLLSRSILQMIYLPTSNRVLGTTSLTDMLKESVKVFIAPPALMPKHPLYNNQQVSCRWNFLLLFFIALISVVLALVYVLAGQRVHRYFLLLQRPHLRELS